MSDQELNKAMGTNIEIEEGTYQMIRSSEMDETIFFSFDDLDFTKNDATGAVKAVALDLGICLVVALYQYIGYCISLKEVKRIVGLR